MKKGIIAIAGIAGLAIVAKKAIDKKMRVKAVLDEFDIKKKSPFAIADKIRTMNDEEYEDFKTKMKQQFPNKCCKSKC